MGPVVTIGLDIAKSVFQVHGVDESGRDCPQTGPTGATPCVLRKAAGLPGRHRSLRHSSPLGSRADQARSPGPAHAAELRMIQDRRRTRTPLAVPVG